MSVEFDPAKNAANLAKHGISLARTGDLDFQTAFIRPDQRRDYGEPRWRAYGMIEDRMHMLAFTMRAGVLMPISLRKANAKEARRYGGPEVEG